MHGHGVLFVTCDEEIAILFQRHSQLLYNMERDEHIQLLNASLSLPSSIQVSKVVARTKKNAKKMLYANKILTDTRLLN